MRWLLLPFVLSAVEATNRLGSPILRANHQSSSNLQFHGHRRPCPFSKDWLKSFYSTLPSTIIPQLEGSSQTLNAKEVNIFREMFDAATRNSVINIEHILFLLSKKKHLLLADGDKATVIKRVMSAFPTIEPVDEQFLALLQRLFECGFLDFIREFHLLRAFTSQQLMELVLKSNKHIFKQKISSKMMEKLIQTNDFMVAEMMLILEVDSSKEARKRNYLDLAYISNSSCQRLLHGTHENNYEDASGEGEGLLNHCLSIENKRYDFIRALKAAGVDFIFSFANYREALRRGLYDWAGALLKAAHLGSRVEYQTGDKKISPLSVALASQNSGIIDEVMEGYLEMLTIEQLLQARAVADWNEQGHKWILQIDTQIKKKRFGNNNFKFNKC